MPKFCNYSFIILTLISINLGFQPIAALSSEKFAVPERLRGNNESGFEFLKSLEKKYNTINLGVGSPNFNPPEYVKQAMINTIQDDNYMFSQYTDSDGEPRLKNAIARLYSKLLNRTLDPENNVYVGIGATQSLFAIIHSHTIPGNEWIIIEPYYGTYVPIVKSANGIPKIVTLRSNKSNGGNTSKDWTFDRAEMAKAFNNKTKGILLNNPHNPTGKVFTYEELKFIANLAKKWDTLVICDEVYEFMIYDDNKHIRIAMLPDMFERTITISSVSKTFSSTGYRLGWAYGGAEVLNNLNFIQSPMIDSCPTPIQEAFARTFEQELRDFGKSYSYLQKFKTLSQMKRDYLIQAIRNLGLHVVVPDSGYFILANFTDLGNRINYNEETGDYEDIKFTKWLIKNVKILGYPLSGYYSLESKHLAEEGIRLTFLKTVTTLDQVKRYVKEYLLKNL